MRYLQIIHALPGRTRLRAPSLRKERALAEAVAQTLASTPGVHEVAVRPYTGSILIEHDPELTATHLQDIVQHELGAEYLLGPHDRPPRPHGTPELSKIAKLAANVFRDLDRELLKISEGSLDLGTAVTLAFFGVGAMQVAVERDVEMPPWFNLAWWGYRTFMTNEQAEIDAVGGIVAEDRKEEAAAEAAADKKEAAAAEAAKH